MNWRHRAVCRDENPELFHPVGTSGPALLQIAEAKAVCRRCPVTAECLAFAMSGSHHGVWGGMSEDERRAMKRRDDARRSRQVPKPAVSSTGRSWSGRTNARLAPRRVV